MTDSPQLPQRNKIVLILVGLIIVLIGLFVWHEVRQHLLAQSVAEQNSAPIVVEIATVQSQVWHPQIQAIGTVLANQGVDVTTQFAGIVQTIYFQSGDYVTEGTKLVQLDGRVLQATAQQSQAKYELAQIDFQRNEKLYKRHVIPLAQLQTSKATMLAAKAQWDTDVANLQNTTILAPFSGNLGLRQINVGQYLAVGTPMVSLQSTNPVLVNFSLAEVYLLKIARGDVVTLMTSAYPGQIFTGKIVAMNSTLDADTRTLQLQAEVPNENKLLMPGMFAQVNVIAPTKDNVLTVPQTAIQYSPFGDTVYIVQNNRAVERYVTLGEQRGATVAVISGLSENETIVTVGANKLQNGTAVITQDELAAAQKASAVIRVEREAEKPKHHFLTSKPTTKASTASSTESSTATGKR